jgi:hypothetical protein
MIININRDISVNTLLWGDTLIVLDKNTITLATPREKGG